MDIGYRSQAVLLRPEWIFCSDPSLVLPTTFCQKLAKPGLFQGYSLWAPEFCSLGPFCLFVPLSFRVGGTAWSICQPPMNVLCLSLLSESVAGMNCPLSCFLFIPAGWNSRTSVRAPSSSRHWVTAPLSSAFASSPGVGLCSLTQWCHSWPTALRSSCATCLWENLSPFAKISSSPLSGGECGEGRMWGFWSCRRFISAPWLAKVYMAWSSCSKELIGNM